MDVNVDVKAMRRRAAAAPGCLRWFIRLAWRVRRALFRVSRWPARVVACSRGRWGALRLTAGGRRTGRERSVILGYFEDGPDLVTLAMNGWGAADPGWWLDLQAHLDARVQLGDGTRDVVAHAATGAERARLWERWRVLDPGLDGDARRRPGETAVVVLQRAGSTRPATADAR